MWKWVNGWNHTCEGRHSGLLDFTQQLSFPSCSCWNRDMVTPVCFHGNFALSLAGLFCPRACVLLVAPASGASFASNASLEVWLCHPCFLWEETKAHTQKGMGSWVLLALESCGLKPVCNCLPVTKESVWTPAEPAKFTSTLGFGKTVEGKSSSRLALAPALENKCSQRGLWVCTCCSVPWNLPARLIPYSAVLPELCTFKRGQVWPVEILFQCFPWWNLLICNAIDLCCSFGSYNVVN